MGISFNSAKYTPEEDYNNILIVDSLNLAFRYKHSNTKNFAATFFSTVDSFAKSYKAKKVFVLGDGGSDYRKRIFPEYKANRQELRDKQTDEEAKAFQEFLEEYTRGLDLCSSKFKVIRYKGVEADDIAAYLVSHICPEDYTHIWLISSDRDWDQLISENVSRFTYTTRKEITFENWADHYPYDIEDHISIKALQGDKGDNVPGCPQIGEKRAYNILRQYGPTAFDVYENLPIHAPQKFIQNLNEFGDQILMNYELMDLLTYCGEALGNNIDELNETIEEYI